MTNLNVVHHQVFSKSNLSVEIAYLQQGWALKSPSENVKFFKLGNKLIALINNVSFFINNQHPAEISDIRSEKSSDGSWLYFVLGNL